MFGFSFLCYGNRWFVSKTFAWLWKENQIKKGMSLRSKATVAFKASRPAPNQATKSSPRLREQKMSTWEVEYICSKERSLDLLTLKYKTDFLFGFLEIWGWIQLFLRQLHFGVWGFNLDISWSKSFVYILKSENHTFFYDYFNLY